MKKYFNKALLLLAISMVAVPGLLIRDIVEGQAVSGPMSNPILHQETSSEPEYLLELSGSEQVVRYTGFQYPEYTIEINSDDHIVQIIPVDASDSTSTLNLLERFILTKHGVAPIESQNVNNIDGNEVEQLAYQLHKHENIHFYEVFSAIKKGNKGWIFITHLEVQDKDKKFNIFKSSQIEYYNTVIKNFKLKDHKLQKARIELKLKSNKDIPKEFLNEGKLLNKSFRSTY